MYYNVTLWCFRVTIVAMESKNAFCVYYLGTRHCQQYNNIERCIKYFDGEFMSPAIIKHI